MEDGKSATIKPYLEDLMRCGMSQGYLLNTSNRILVVLDWNVSLVWYLYHVIGIELVTGICCLGGFIVEA